MLFLIVEERKEAIIYIIFSFKYLVTVSAYEFDQSNDPSNLVKPIQEMPHIASAVSSARLSSSLDALLIAFSNSYVLVSFSSSSSLLFCSTPSFISNMEISCSTPHIIFNRKFSELNDVLSV